jgi:hypothetical protein
VEVPPINKCDIGPSVAYRKNITQATHVFPRSSKKRTAPPHIDNDTVALKTKVVDRALQYTSKQLGEGTKLAIVEPNAKSKREVPPNTGITNAGITNAGITNAGLSTSTTGNHSTIIKPKRTQHT